MTFLQFFNEIQKVNKNITNFWYYDEMITYIQMINIDFSEKELEIIWKDFDIHAKGLLRKEDLADALNIPVSYNPV